MRIKRLQQRQRRIKHRHSSIHNPHLQDTELPSVLSQQVLVVLHLFRISGCGAQQGSKSCDKRQICAGTEVPEGAKMLGTQCVDEADDSEKPRFCCVTANAEESRVDCAGGSAKRTDDAAMKCDFGCVVGEMKVACDKLARLFHKESRNCLLVEESR